MGGAASRSIPDETDQLIATLRCYTPNVYLLPRRPDGTYIRFRVPLFIQDMFVPSLPDFIDLEFQEGPFKRSDHIQLEFESAIAVPPTKVNAASALVQNNSRLPNDMVLENDENYFEIGSKYYSDTEVDNEPHVMHDFFLRVSAYKRVEIIRTIRVEITLTLPLDAGEQTGKGSLKYHPLGSILKKLEELPLTRSTFRGPPRSTINAERRAELMGMPVEKCRWTEYSADKCNNEEDPVSYDEFEEGDMVWQTTSGTCFGPEQWPEENGTELVPYQEPYFMNSDILMNPTNRSRLEPGCFRRVKKEDSDEFPPRRRVRQRTD